MIYYLVRHGLYLAFHAHALNTCRSWRPTVYLMRIGAPGAEKPVARIDDEHYVDVSDVVDRLRRGVLRRRRARRAPRRRRGPGGRGPGGGRSADERIGAPIARPHQILCIGLNYSDHAAETGQAVPDEPILFTKSPNTLVGPNDDVRIPRGSTKTDWEVELGIVIGRRTQLPRLGRGGAATPSPATSLVNDVSERAFQIERGGQWSKGKSAETFNPAGPWLVTPDEIDDVLAPRHVARRQRRPPADRVDLDDGLRPVLHRALPQPVPGAGAGRPHQHRHPARRRDGLRRRRSGCSPATSWSSASTAWAASASTSSRRADASGRAEDRTQPWIRPSARAMTA